MSILCGGLAAPTEIKKIGAIYKGFASQPVHNAHKEE
jgi:hypothetical protein